MQYHGGKKLPPGWVKCTSNKYGRDYFFDTQTGQSVWFPPADATTAGDGAAAALSAPRLPPPPPSSGQEDGGAESFSPPAKRARQQEPSSPPGGNGESGTNKVAVIVPYRDLDPAQRRSAHLEQFVPYMEDFLARAVARTAAAAVGRGEGAVGGFHVYVVEQSADDGLKFNRGKLLNIGFDLARREGCGAFLLHDVDLLPSDELARWYSTVPERPVHVAKVWKQYSNNPKYFGGVVAFNRQDFEAINGFPNTFWGWGGEDDEMYSRIVEAKLEPQKAEEGEFTDLEGLDLTSKLDLLRKNKQWKCQVKREALEEHSKTWRQNGLADLKYTVLSRVPLATGTEKVTVDVGLNGHWTDTITDWQDLHKRGTQ
ncbi:unnamed protein product [Scytosiphon promiscuus]